MKKIIIIYFILSLLGKLSFSQSYIVVDSLTKEPIPYATIKFKKSPKGFYANGKGYFSLNEKVNDTLQISCLGYESVYETINSLKDTIILIPKPIKLDEVVINKGKKKKEILGLKRKKGNFHINPNFQIALLIKPSEKFANKQIENIIIPINKKSLLKKQGKTFKSVFKINIYRNDSGLPKHPMLEKPIDIFVTHNSKNSITVDFSEELIDFSKEGIFICIEMIGEINEKEEVINSINPRPSFVFTNKEIKDIFSKSYFKTKFSNEWKPMSTKTFHLEEEIFLAIGLTLSSYD